MRDSALLAPDEPLPFVHLRPRARSPFLIIVDHAGRRIPRRLGSLGLPAAELERHIAWDLGALDLATRMSGILDATLIAQPYSRLVIDCNRDPTVPSSIPCVSESVAIPGNLDLPNCEREARRREIFDPYHARIAQALDARAAGGGETLLIAQHTMTDVYAGSRRAMHAAVLYNRDRRLAGRVLEELRRDAALLIADNAPYFLSDATDYTIPVHGERRGLLHVEIEVRQDLLAGVDGVQAWASRLAAALKAAVRALAAGGGGGVGDEA